MDFSIKHTILDRIVFFGICIVLAVVPLASGKADGRFDNIIGIVVFTLGILLVLDRLVFTRRGSFEWIRTPLNWFFPAIFVLIVLQVIPIPFSWLEIFSPVTASDKSAMAEILKASGQTGIERASFGYYRHAVVIQGLKLAAGVVLFFLVLYTARSRQRIDILMYTLIGTGFLKTMLVIYQAIGMAAGKSVVHAYLEDGYTGILVLLTFGLILAQQGRARRAASGMGGLRAGIQNLIGWFGSESLSLKIIFLFFALMFIGTTFLIVDSGNTIFIFGISLAAFSILLLLKRSFRRSSVFPMLLALLTITYGIHQGTENGPTYPVSKGMHPQQLSKNIAHYDMIHDYPYLGVGWGNYRYLAPRYGSNGYTGFSKNGNPVSGWFKFGAELGYTGIALTAAAMAMFLYKMARVWKNRRDPLSVGIGIGTMAGCLFFGVKGVSNADALSPVVLMTVAAAASIGYAAVHRRGMGVMESFIYPSYKIALPDFRQGILAATILGLLCVGILGTGRHLLAEAASPTGGNPGINDRHPSSISHIQTAIRHNPWNAEYYNSAAQYYTGTKTKSGSERKAFDEKADRGLERAVVLNPANGVYWYNLGKRYALPRDDHYAYLNKWLPLSEDCFAMAVSCATGDADIQFDVARYWVWRSRMLPIKTDGSTTQPNRRVQFRKDGVNKFQTLFQRALELDPGRWKWAVDRVLEYFPNDAIVLGIVPTIDENMKKDVLRYLIRIKG